MSESSYTNAPKAEATFRRVPYARVLDIQRDRMADCDCSTGHVLRFEDGLIYCLECDAKWKDEGF